jgi:hypothetical protein
MTRMMFDGVRAVDYLESLPNVDKARIGGMGHHWAQKRCYTPLLLMSATRRLCLVKAVLG